MNICSPPCPPTMDPVARWGNVGYCVKSYLGENLSRPNGREVNVDGVVYVITEKRGKAPGDVTYYGIRKDLM